MVALRGLLNTFSAWLGVGLLTIVVSALQCETSHASDVIVGESVGSCPGGDSPVPLLGIPANSASPILWHLTLFSDAAGQSPTRYHLSRSYNLQSDAAQEPPTLSHLAQQTGACKTSAGIPGQPHLLVYELEDLCSLVCINESILHVLNADRSLMIGTGGQSFTLYANNKTEKPGDRSIALTRSSTSYKIDPLFAGPSVFGIFEGRTPGRGIARQLGMGDDRGRLKAKWRVTLYQDPDTKRPTTYKIEGTLFRQQVRSGTWDINTHQSSGASQTFYRLHAANDQPELLLQKGDDNVLYFADAQGALLVGHADFSYTLNRRPSADDAQTQRNN